MASSHHAVLDGKTSTSFIKSWAYLCNNLGEEESPSSLLPPELSLIYDKELVRDPKGIEERYVSEWLKHGGPNNKSLKLWDLQFPEDATRGLFQLSRSHIEKLKQIVVSNSKKKKGNKLIHLSKFVISVAYACICRVKAEEIKSERVVLGLGVDCSARLEPPLPPTYFGNCIAVRLAVAETRELLGEEGLIVAVEALNSALESLKEGVLKGVESWASMLLGDDVTNDKIISVSGSPRFDVYSNDLVGEDKRKWR